ncbi:hypothetical protein FHX42_002617 [Saccharopolyspora lacisalsi]|uniref:Uncharacterized protein n=1 Tax=Halosaccharopolyspora lacisalsi TaxID=1000566 RepID=A0A839DYI1_9PSEU|nr:hypothetical protein [Halosaccharopolyspora lacisalsi]MBA8825266.1 hypothetical protein [Halosaccharopolyspora lacisalsi]
MPFFVLILTFFGGFALAVFLFWPIQRRGSRGHAGSFQRSSPSTGKHALDRTATNPVSIPVQDRVEQSKGASVAKHSVLGRSATATTSAYSPETTSETGPEKSGDKTEPAAEFPQEDLFSRHHAAKFDQARQRLAKVRVELDSS